MNGGKALDVSWYIRICCRYARIAYLALKESDYSIFCRFAYQFHFFNPCESCSVLLNQPIFLCWVRLVRKLFWAEWCSEIFKSLIFSSNYFDLISQIFFNFSNSIWKFCFCVSITSSCPCLIICSFEASFCITLAF